MTGTKWAASGFIALLAAFDLLVTVSAHHRVGAASSLGQVLGWVLFVVLVVPTCLMIGLGLRQSLAERRYRKTYARLERQDQLGE
jgi:hypothetical protein